MIGKREEGISVKGRVWRVHGSCFLLPYLMTGDIN